LEKGRLEDKEIYEGERNSSEGGDRKKEEKRTH